MSGASRSTVISRTSGALLTACTSHYFAANPPPDPAPWAGIADPEHRLGVALGELYAFYRRTEGMLARAEQDVPANPILADLLTPFVDYQIRIRDILAEGRPADPLVTAAIGLALAFGTWRSLTRDQGLDDAQAVTIMQTLVRCASQGGGGVTSISAWAAVGA